MKRAIARRLIPMAILSAALVAASAHAQDRYSQRSDGQSTTLEITFQSAPHWTPVSGTRVEEIRQGERPDYDMFRYDNRYYVYDNNRWYTSSQWRGAFTYVDLNSVPRELSMVPRDHWRQYPSEWQDQRTDNWNEHRDDSRNARRSDGWNGRRSDGWNGRGNDGWNDGSATLQVNFGTRPRWRAVRGTRVWEIRQGPRRDYDMFRYGDTYYVYNDDQWYSSRQWRGEFRLIDDRSVPREVAMVPRSHWRNYPERWADQNMDPRDDYRDRRHR